MIRNNLILPSTFSVVLLATWTATATGPVEQNSSINGIPRLLSHVQVRNAGGSGSGTIIDKKVDANGDAWVCVLTADHVVRGQNNHMIDIGSGTVASYGGADSWFLSASPVGVRGRDIAVLGIRIGNVNTNPGAAARYNSLSPVNLGFFGADYNPANPNSINRTIFTEHGYGDTGSFVNGGMQGAANNNPIRHFQNNQVERWIHTNTANYDYRGIQWDFNVPAGAGPLLTEGLSFVGDSGGAYTTSQLETKGVNNAFRENIHVNADGTGSIIPSIPAGSQLGLWVDSLIAVHTRGNSDNAGFNAFTTYNANGTPNVHTWGAGVAMTADTLTWVNAACAVVPAPSVGSIALVGMIAVARRRR